MKLQRQNSSFELMFSLFAALILLGALLVWLLLPEVQAKQAYVQKLNAGTKLTEKMQEDYDRLYDIKRGRAEQDSAIAEALENEADHDALQRWFEQFIGDCKVQTLAGSENIVVVTGSLQSPAALYEMVYTLPQAPWVLQLQMPLALLGNGNGIAATLHFRIVRPADAVKAVQKSPDA